MKNFLKRMTFVLLDVFLISLTLYLAFITKHGTNELPSFEIGEWLVIFLSLASISILVNYLTGLYRNLWQYASINELLNVLLAGFLTELFFFIAMTVIGYKISYSVHFLILIFNTVFLGVSRLGYRMARRVSKLNLDIVDDEFERVLIIGAGDAGAMVIRELRRHYEMKLDPVALIDDDEAKHDCKIMGVRVYGGRDKIRQVVKELDIDMIIFALPSAPKQVQTEILDICNQTKCKLKILPGVYEIINDSVSVQQLRDVQIEDLLGRDPIDLDVDNICGYIKDAVVLVTGGGGSIGSELCRQIARFNPKKLLILDIYENNAYELQQELYWQYPDLDQEVLIGSVRDRARMEAIFDEYRPSTVFHAAAHKHVPLMEHSPMEAIKNNVFGTLNVAECADKYGSKRFVLISTDKAVNPTNIMGASKRLAEMVIQGMNRGSKTQFVAVRFGNVLGSNGSVIPLFKKQIAEGGPVTITHPKITRFFMTIPEAVQLVLEAGSMAKGGEIFVLDMGKPVKIVDLAKDLIRLSGLEPGVDIAIKYTGLRPGEKLYEELMMAEEGLRSTSHRKIFIGRLSEVDIVELKKDLEKLKFVLTGPKDSLIDYIKQLVPTYSEPAEEIVATLDENH